MEFSPEREQELLEQNMYKIYRAVDNYSARHSSSTATVPYEDFVQEVALAYIKYIRSCKTMDEVNRFPWYTAMGAMRDLVLMYQPMSCPKTHESKFSDIIHGMPTTMSIDDIMASSCIEIDGMSKHWVEDKETQIDFDDFMKDQPDHLKRVASMRVYGMTLKEIGNQCGINKNAVRKRLGKLNDAYKLYMEGESNE